MSSRAVGPTVLVLALVASLLIAPAPTLSTARAQSTARVYVDGQVVTFDQPPIISGSRVLVPLRGVFERMGAVVAWDSNTQTVLALRADTAVKLQIGQRTAFVNDRPIQLDVPAMLVNGRTLVPLRFIGESLGARVDWQEASRAVLIWTQPGAGGSFIPPPPVAQTPPPAEATIKGVLTAVILPQSVSDQAKIVVQAGDISYTVRITTDTAISRVDSSGAGGSVGVAALRPGDDIEVTTANGMATRIRARYLMTAPSKIEAFVPNSRTIVLADGATIKYVPGVEVMSGDTVVGPTALKAGQVVQMRLNPTTKEAWRIVIINGGAETPPANGLALTVTTPTAGQSVGNPIEVRGTTAPGAKIDIIVTWFLGLPVGRQTVTANADGMFAAKVPVTLLAKGSPYLVTVSASHPKLGNTEQQFTVSIA